MAMLNPAGPTMLVRLKPSRILASKVVQVRALPAILLLSEKLMGISVVAPFPPVLVKNALCPPIVLKQVPQVPGLTGEASSVLIVPIVAGRYPPSTLANLGLRASARPRPPFYLIAYRVMSLLSVALCTEGVSGAML